MILIKCFEFIVILKSVQIFSYTTDTKHNLEENSTPLIDTKHNLEENSTPLIDTKHILEENSTPLIDTKHILEENSTPLIGNNSTWTQIDEIIKNYKTDYKQLMIIGFGVSGVILCIIIIQSITLCIINGTCKSKGTRKNVNRLDARSIVSESGAIREEIEENQDIEHAPNLAYQNLNELQESSSSPTKPNVKNKATTSSPKLPCQRKVKDTKSTVETPMKRMKRLSKNLGSFFKVAKPQGSATSAQGCKIQTEISNRCVPSSNPLQYPEEDHESDVTYGNLMEMEELSKPASTPTRLPGIPDRKRTATTLAPTFLRQHNVDHTGSPSTPIVQTEPKRAIHLGNQIGTHLKVTSILNNRQSSYSVDSEEWTYEPIEEIYEQLDS